jgi:hypothetical protein
MNVRGIVGAIKFDCTVSLFLQRGVGYGRVCSLKCVYTIGGMSAYTLASQTGSEKPIGEPTLLQCSCSG